MSALTAARTQVVGDGFYIEVPMTASTTIYQGGGVMLVSGTAVPAADTSGATRLGVALETKTSGASIVSYIRVAIKGVYRFAAGAGTAANATWFGVAVYWTDDQTVDLAATTTNDIKAGTVVKVVDVSTVDVLIDMAA